MQPAASRRAAVLLGLWPFASAGASGQSADPVLVPRTSEVRPLQAPLRLADSVRLSPFAVLGPAREEAAERVEALRSWNQAGGRPLKNGFVRELPRRRAVASLRDLSRTPAVGEVTQLRADGSAVWTLRVEVRDAFRLRLHLQDVHLPAGTRLWVYGEDGETVGPFGEELIGPQRDLWTPSVGGEVVTLEMAVPAGAVREPLRYELGEVLELFSLDESGAPSNAASPSHALGCLVDSRCMGPDQLAGIDLYRKAVAHLQMTIDGSSEICTGALLNDLDDSSFIPYLLTASHCVPRQEVASTLEVFWDYVTPSCGGPWPALFSLPRSHGATLLAMSLQTDFSLLRLHSIPEGRAMLGWNASPSAVREGTGLHRISHPLGRPQAYSSSVVIYPATVCPADLEGRPWDDRTKFLYSAPRIGAAFHGGSGAPVVLDNGQVVGQLLGGCGRSANEPCLEGAAPNQVDGRFSVTYPAIAPWLDPSGVFELCVEDQDTLCLNDGRFRVEATFETPQGQTGAAHVVRLTDETGYLWFFTESNVEVVIKVLNACASRGRYWVFAGGLTNVRTVITVTDSRTGVRKTYTNPQRQAFQPIQDTSAFATCP